MNHYKFFLAVFCCCCLTWIFCRASFFFGCAGGDFTLFSVYTQFLLVSNFCFSFLYFLFETLHLIDNRWCEWQRERHNRDQFMLLLFFRIITQYPCNAIIIYSLIQCYCLNEKWAQSGNFIDSPPAKKLWSAVCFHFFKLANESI